MSECQNVKGTVSPSQRSLKVIAPNKWSDGPGHPHYPDWNPEVSAADVNDGSKCHYYLALLITKVHQ